MSVPVYINVRDRVTPLRDLVAWLEHAGCDRITLLDNASTYPPLLEYLDQTPHTVVRLGENLGSKAIWHAGLVPDEWYVYTDPDVVPTADCPLDAINHLQRLVEEWPRYPKAGLGLHLRDVPPQLPVLEWEESLVSPDRQLAPGVFNSLVDTTFAVYRPGAAFDYIGIRTGFPYEARHTSWYATTPGPEDRYYLDRATDSRTGGSSWKDWVH